MTVRLKTTVDMFSKSESIPEFTYRLSDTGEQVVRAACKNLGKEFIPRTTAYLRESFDAELCPLFECDHLQSYTPKDGAILYIQFGDANAESRKSLAEMFTDIENYTFEEQIGAGAYSRVWKGRDKSSKAVVALKMLTNADTGLREQLHEIESMLIDAPNILKVTGWTVPSETHDYATIITEYMPNGSLARVVSGELSLNDTQKQIVFYGVADALLRAHTSCTYHRDVKPENILLNDRLEPVISDFGVAYLLSTGMTDVSRGGCVGTRRYMAPEVYQGPLYAKVDQFAYALTVWSVLTGEIPFKDKNIWEASDLIRDGKRPEIPERLPSQYKKLLREMWAQEPNQRPSFEEIMNRFRQGHLHLPNTDQRAFREYVKMLETSNPARELGYQTEINKLRRAGDAKTLELRGKEVQVDDPESALHFFLSSAALGNMMGFAWAAYMCKRLGKEGAYLRYLREAADRGHAWSQVWYAQKCLRRKMFDDAEKYFKKSLTSGIPAIVAEAKAGINDLKKMKRR